MFSRRRITNDQEKDQEEQNEYEDDKQGVTDDNVASVGLRVYTVRVCSQVSSLGIPSRIIHRSSHTPTHTHTHTHTHTRTHTHTHTLYDLAADRHCATDNAPASTPRRPSLSAAVTDTHERRYR
eukprot:GHVU01013250.1.p1 GENE.GHVU01013250.1~~GHVU01013250.1.p1  ORF type:complete len:124 (-),score=17.10 GHVU01013250.1:154-525(-)